MKVWRRTIPGLMLILAAAAHAEIPSGYVPPQRTDLPGIVGRDDRVPLDSTAWPWQALGRINQVGGYAHCTGTLVAPDTVLTAAHCVYSAQAGRWLKPDEVIFAAGFRRDVWLDYAKGVSIRRSSDQPPSPAMSQIGHDWAMIRLEHRMAIRPVSIRSLVDGAAGTSTATPHLLTAGYAMDRPYLLSMNDGCRIQGRTEEGRVLITNCDSTKGDSGAPLLLRDGSQYWVVGVFSAATAAHARDAHSFAVDASVFMK